MAAPPPTSAPPAPATRPPPKASKQLLPHERDLLAAGALQDVTHHGASSIWLDAPSTQPPPGHTVVYRPMGDTELLFLLAHNQLPGTQPYQAIIEGPPGREYSEKYLNGKKWVDSCPTTVVEFTPPAALIALLMGQQCKVEDGAVSMGLGDKAGGGLGLFNASLACGDTTWRIVKVKRSKEKAATQLQPGASEKHAPKSKKKR
eukprot:gnl/Hemi2/28456_TR9417_c0_g1_i1.p1 gnl/Hemi2/28456_TR9417_c0_g1~~gnl/Hemi2/28456_TR9417_c0_g1_i1.p1  ORF type:complete len:203 (-),score=78.02 gnl/Hemi2/28456_TR9417_c0_g1_i1:292-900(-)